MDDRRQLILLEVARRGACTYAELAELAGVSTMTIRRDVDALARQRRVIKTLGGVQDATAANNWYESDIQSRLNANVQEKMAIAACALDLIAERQTLFVDGGTTCSQLARKIAEARDGLTIVTNSAFVCLELGRNRRNKIISLGGQFDPDSVPMGFWARENRLSRT